MDELEKLRKENRLLKDKIQKLEETLSIAADMNKSNEIGVYVKCRQRMISLMRLVNNTSENTKVNVLAQQEKLKRAEEEKTVLDAKILKETGISMRGISNREVNYTPENQFTYRNIALGIEIVSYIGKTNAEEVRIPQIIQGQNVVGIGERAFIGKDIKRVYLPGTIQYIKRKAFSGCHQLEHISIPEGIKEMGEYSFSLTGLREVIIPQSVRKIPNDCFSECSQLKKIELKEGLCYIGRYAFAATGLEEIVIPESVSIIEYNAFAGIRPATRKTKVILLGNSMYPKELPDNIVIEHRDK